MRELLAANQARRTASWTAWPKEGRKDDLRRGVRCATLMANSPRTRRRASTDAGFLATRPGRLTRDAESAWATLRAEFPDHPRSPRAPRTISSPRGAFGRGNLGDRGCSWRWGAVKRRIDAAIRAQAQPSWARASLAQAGRARRTRPSRPPWRWRALQMRRARNNALPWSGLALVVQGSSRTRLRLLRRSGRRRRARQGACAPGPRRAADLRRRPSLKPVATQPRTKPAKPPGEISQERASHEPGAREHAGAGRAAPVLGASLRGGA